jgi:hypothetical protein
MNQGAVVSSVKSLDDARRILSQAASHPEDLAALRSLLKDISSLLPECECDDPEYCECEDNEDDETLEDEKAAKSILQNLVLELRNNRE